MNNDVSVFRMVPEQKNFYNDLRKLNDILAYMYVVQKNIDDRVFASNSANLPNIILPTIPQPPVITQPPIIPQPPIVVKPPIIPQPPVITPPIIVKPPVITPPIIVKPPTIPQPPVITPPIIVKPPTIPQPPVIMPPIIVKPPIIPQSPIIVKPPVVITPPITTPLPVITHPNVTLPNVPVPKIPPKAIHVTKMIDINDLVINYNKLVDKFNFYVSVAINIYNKMFNEIDVTSFDVSRDKKSFYKKVNIPNLKPLQLSTTIFPIGQTVLELVRVMRKSALFLYNILKKIYETRYVPKI